jgi:hypothetical protein
MGDYLFCALSLALAADRRPVVDIFDFLPPATEAVSLPEVISGYYYLTCTILFVGYTVVVYVIAFVI